MTHHRPSIRPTYPRLYRLAWSENIGGDPSGFDEQQEFLFGLDRILDDVQTLMDQVQTDSSRSPRPDQD